MRKEFFHLDGKAPVESDKLKMFKRGDFNPSAQSLTKEGRTSSFLGPLFASRPEVAAPETTTTGWVRHIFSIWVTNINIIDTFRDIGTEFTDVSGTVTHLVVISHWGRVSDRLPLVVSIIKKSLRIMLNTVFDAIHVGSIALITWMPMLSA
jgi:hypothetical protein